MVNALHKRTTGNRLYIIVIIIYINKHLKSKKSKQELHEDNKGTADGFVLRPVKTLQGHMELIHHIRIYFMFSPCQLAPASLQLEVVPTKL